MANHFYSVVAPAQTMEHKKHNIVVGTATVGANVIEVRIVDGALTAQQAREFLRWMANLIATRDTQVIATGTLKTY